MVFAGVNAILSKSLEELKQQYYPVHEGQIMQDMHWNCVKKNLDVLLLAVSALEHHGVVREIHQIGVHEQSPKWYALSPRGCRKCPESGSLA